MSEEIKATQENTKETKKGFAELKKALITQNEKDASKRAVELARTIANEDKKIDELTAKIEKQTQEAKSARELADKKDGRLKQETINQRKETARIAENTLKSTLSDLELIKETRENRKTQQDNRSSARKSLDLEKNSLSALQKQIEDAGGVAEDSLEFRRAQNRIRRQELALRKSEATSPAARKEIRKEQRKELFNAFKLAIAPVSERLGGLLNSFKSIAGTSTGIPGLSLGRLAFLAAIPFIIKFLDSETFKNLKETIIKNVLPALDFFYNRLFLPVARFIRFGFTNTFKNIKEAIFGADGQGGPGSLAYSLELFKKGDVFGALKNTIGTLFTFFKKTIDENLTKLVKTVLEPLFGFEMIGEGETFFSVVGDFAQNIFNKIRELFTRATVALKQRLEYVFSFELLADIFDSAFPALKGRNPFRRKIIERDARADEAALSARETATYGETLSQALYGDLVNKDFPTVGENEFVSASAIALRGSVAQKNETKKLLEERKKLSEQFKVERQIQKALEDLYNELFPDENKRKKSLTNNDIRRQITSRFLQDEGGVITLNQPVSAEVKRVRVEGMRLTLLASEIKKMEDERALNLIKQQQLQDSNLGGFFSMPVITDGRVTNNAKTIAPMLVTESDQFLSHGLNSVGGFSRP